MLFGLLRLLVSSINYHLVFKRCSLRHSRWLFRYYLFSRHSKCWVGSPKSFGDFGLAIIRH